jgi:hypothetical protein
MINLDGHSVLIFLDHLEPIDQSKFMVFPKKQNKARGGATQVLPDASRPMKP